jgi:signal transduction histidine kinase
MTVRTRILLWYVGLVALALVVSGILTRELLLQYLQQQADRELSSEVNELPGIVHHVPAGSKQTLQVVLSAALVRFTPETDSAAATFVRGRVFGTPKGRPWLTHLISSRTIRSGAGGNVAVSGSVLSAQGSVRYLIEPVTVPRSTDHGAFIVATSMARQDHLASVVTRLGAETAVAALLIASLIAWLVAGRLMRPVRTVTETAKTISESDLSGRIPVHGHDEISVLAETFNEMLARLEAAFTSQRAFVQDAGHELRTPITIIRGQLEVMGDDPEEQSETLDLVFDELDRMDRMVKDLLTLATLARPQPLQLAPVSLSVLADELVAKVRVLAPRRWRLDFRADSTPAALDAQRITQAMLQLCSNAVQHTDDGDTITISVVTSDRRIRMSVHDDGPGIASSDQDRIFERFSRAGDGRRRSDGSGLGLAIVSAIAQTHGGTASVRSAPGRGATFTIDVPLVEPVADVAGSNAVPYGQRRMQAVDA